MGRQQIHILVWFYLTVALGTNAQPSGIKCTADGYFPDPDHCDQFFRCYGRQLIHSSCPIGLHFDVVHKICNWKIYAKCGTLEDIITTTEPTYYGNWTAPPPLCPKGKIPCPSEVFCINASQKCDGEPDCPDGLDEILCDGSINYTAEFCNPKECLLPDCFCTKDGTQIPGNLQPNETPQMVMLSFGGVISDYNYRKYQNLFDNKITNPNNCSIRGTFFVSHDYTNYYQVQKLFSQGHEIGIDSVSHRNPQYWWLMASQEDWESEIIGQKNILNTFARIPLEEIRGMRAPFLQPGGNKQFQVLKDNGILYDSTLSVPPFITPIWFYTLDYKMPHKCIVRNCPSKSFSGVWEMPLNQLGDPKSIPCALVTQCGIMASENEVYAFLNVSFQRHYTQNRAPMSIYLDSKWLEIGPALRGLKQFLRDILDKKDVWILTHYQALQWVQDPTPLSDIDSFMPWKCNKTPGPICKSPRTCQLPFNDSETRYMQVCGTCPVNYPWVGNTGGEL